MKELKIYLAAQYELRDQLREIRERLHKIPGLRCISTWLDTQNTALGSDEETRHKWAQEDIKRVKECDVFVLFTFLPDGDGITIRGGREVEFGVALACEKKCYIIGPKVNIFHHLGGNVIHFKTFEALLIALEFECRFIGVG